MLIFHELPPSPNNTKVRMALRYKGIDFETSVVGREDRAALVELSGQEMTPVLEDTGRGVVLPDSEAILQYLDANWRETPRLFPAEKTARRECARFERELDERLAQPWMNPFFFAIGVQATLDAHSVEHFQAGLDWLDKEIGSHDHVRGPDRPICDLRAAQWATYALPGEPLVERCPLFAEFAELFAVPRGSFRNLERFLVPWQERLR